MCVWFLTFRISMLFGSIRRESVLRRISFGVWRASDAAGSKKARREFPFQPRCLGGHQPDA
jgi:hypothetical protein